MCATHWRVVFELWCADVSDALCSWSEKLCAPDSFSRSTSVTLRPPLPQGSSLTPTLSRHFCSPTSVSVCGRPEAFFLPHTLVWRFHKLYARAASQCHLSDYLAPRFRVSQRLPTMNRQVECNPTLEGSHMAFKLNWCHHELIAVIHHCGAPAPQPASRNVSSV